MGGIVTDLILINGSPKTKGSASGVILQGLKQALPREISVRECAIRTAPLTEEAVQAAVCSDVLVFAFPLYVDGLPSHMIDALLKLECSLKSAPPKERFVYAIANCGFYEGHQCAPALQMMENWSARSNLSWGQGLGVGAGGMLSGLESVPMGAGLKKNLGKALRAMAGRILSCEQAETSYITANFPRYLYKAAAEIGWRKGAKANGLRTKDLFAQPGKEDTV